jgi:hypothetical protein
MLIATITRRFGTFGGYRTVLKFINLNLNYCLTVTFVFSTNDLCYDASLSPTGTSWKILNNTPLHKTICRQLFVDDDINL